jgi:hypothetical protein
MVMVKKPKDCYFVSEISHCFGIMALDTITLVDDIAIKLIEHIKMSGMAYYSLNCGILSILN